MGDRAPPWAHGDGYTSRTGSREACSKRMFHAGLSGLSATVELSVISDGKLVDRRRGSMLWTHFGISGPVVLDASRHWVAARSKSTNATVRMQCNFMPGDDANRARTRGL